MLVTLTFIFFVCIHLHFSGVSNDFQLEESKKDVLHLTRKEELTIIQPFLFKTFLRKQVENKCSFESNEI